MSYLDKKHIAWLRTKRRVMDAYWAVRILPYRVRRTWRMAKMYWVACSTCGGDWSNIAEVLRYEIGETRKAIKRHDIIMNAEIYCDQMAEAEHLLTRIIDEPYYEIAGKRYPEHGPAWAKMIDDLEKQDMERLTTILRKYLRHWWD